MAKIKPKVVKNKLAHVNCDYCLGYERRILEDHDHSEVTGSTEDFIITDPMSGESRSVCDQCIRLIGLEKQIIGLMDVLLNSEEAKRMRKNFNNLK